MTIPFYTNDIPAVTSEQMREVDRAMVEDMGITLVQMMENAGRALAHLARMRFLAGNPCDKHVVILAGTGGNGGGALVCARRLHIWGARVQVFLPRPAGDVNSVPAQQLGILERMQVTIAQAEALVGVSHPDLIVDGLIGYSLKGTPRGTVVAMIRWANAQGAPILALDTPSGLDTTTGIASDPAIKARATLTLALPKVGLRVPGAEAQVGELYLADISVPASVYAAPALRLQVADLFAESDVLRLR